MPARPARTEIVVTGIGVVTPWGDALAEAASGPRAVTSDDGWFDVRTRLGARGYKYLPAASQYMLAAARAALEDAGDALDLVPEEARGAAVGTNCGAAALHAEMDRTVIGGSADELSPALAPVFSINLFGSRLATEHALKGFNLTLTSPRTAALEALETGVRSLRLGRASWLLAGAAEASLDAGEPGRELSEAGAVALVCEPRRAALERDARILGTCRVRTLFLPPAAARAGIAAAVEALGYGAAGAAALLVLDDSEVGEAVAAAFGREAVRLQARAGCLEPLLQVAGALAAGDDERLVVTAAAEGNVAVAHVVPEAARRGGSARASERRIDVRIG